MQEFKPKTKFKLEKSWQKMAFNIYDYIRTGNKITYKELQAKFGMNDLAPILNALSYLLQKRLIFITFPHPGHSFSPFKINFVIHPVDIKKEISEHVPKMKWSSYRCCGEKVIGAVNKTHHITMRHSDEIERIFINIEF